MFSQRNNPYCDLLHFSLTNVGNISEKSKDIWKIVLSLVVEIKNVIL